VVEWDSGCAGAGKEGSRAEEMRVCDVEDVCEVEEVSVIA
jgi:hypothetical protein